MQVILSDHNCEGQADAIFQALHQQEALLFLPRLFIPRRAVPR